MKSKIHKYRFQVAIVDEDAEGDPVNEVWLELQEWIGQKNFKAGLSEYLTQLDQFIVERNAAFTELEEEPEETS